MLKLIINNIECDLSETTGFNLNKRFEDLQNPTNYYSEYSKTIELPITPTNNTIFKNFYRLDSIVDDSTIDARKKQPFLLLWNNEIIMRGYAKLENTDTIINDNKYSITLYSSFGLVINELKQLTFNPNVDIDEKYKIYTPFNEDIVVDRTLVEACWRQTDHLIDSNDILDWIGFIPTYQGLYSDFESNNVEVLPKYYSELPKERDEHYMREFRSYYQQPYIWVDKMWKILKDKCKEISGYDMILHPSWFSKQNPYYHKLIYTCPNLYNGDDNFVALNETYNEDLHFYEYNVNQQCDLSNSHKVQMEFDKKSGYGIYNPTTAIFNEDLKGGTEFKADIRFVLMAHQWTPTPNGWAKIQRDNPFLLTFRAVNANTNEPIFGAKHTYLLYSSATSYNSVLTYDDKIDLGITKKKSPNLNYGTIPSGYSKQDSFFWDCFINLNLTIEENVPYYIEVDCKNVNNGEPFEHSISQYIPRWDWLWADFFNEWEEGSIYDHNGCTMLCQLTGCECNTKESLRSNSQLSMYRVFPKDTTLLDVMLNYCKMFGLLWDVNEQDKTITITTRNNYFNDKVVEDWSDKVDRSKSFVFKPINFDTRYVYFNVDDGQCERLKYYQDKYEYGYGCKKLDTGYDFNTDSKDLYKGIVPSVISQKAQASYFINTEYPKNDVVPFMGYNYKIYPNEHYVDNDNNGSNAGMSGAFYFRDGFFTPDSRLDNGEGNIRITDDSEDMILKGSYCSNFTDRNMLTDKVANVIDICDKKSIHFYQPIEYFYNAETTGVRYIYEAFWEQFIEERYNKQNKVLTAYLYLSPTDYRNFTFYKFVTIDNVLYHINQIFDFDFDVNTPTKVELVQVWQMKAYSNGQDVINHLGTIQDLLNASIETQHCDVYSSHYWTIDSKPSWIVVNKDDDGFTYKANSEPLRARFGYIVLSNTAGLTYKVKVWQTAVVQELTIKQTSVLFNADGGTKTITFNAQPTAIVTTNKDWCDILVEENIGNELDNTTIRINVPRNRTTEKRNANITITAGLLQKIVVITQLGSRDYDFFTYDEPIHLVEEPTDVNMFITKELDINTVRITRGSATAPTKKIGNLSITAQGALPTGKTSSGGQLSVDAMDGTRYVINYNCGIEKPSRTLKITANGGTIEVDGKQYATICNMMALQGRKIAIKAYPADKFLRWSDGNENNERTITLNANTTLYPIFSNEEE